MGNRQGKATFFNFQQESANDEQMSKMSKVEKANYTQRSVMTDQSKQFFLGRTLSQYKISKSKWIDADFELMSVKGKLKPENGVRIVANKVKNYERKEMEYCLLSNKEII